MAFNGGVLLERHDQMLALERLLADATGGEGRMVFLAGEAGVGKTALVAAFCSQVARDGGDVTVRRGACDDLTTPAPLGPVVEALPELEPLVEDAGLSRHTLFRRVREVLAGAPTVLVVEDVHWADEATLDLLRFMGRRLEGLPLLLVATYRDSDTPPGHPLAVLLGDLGASPSVRRLRVPPLSPAAVRTLVHDRGSAVDAGLLHARTGGNAFYVTEVLASGGQQLPATVRDAVLARASRLGGDAREVLAAAAVLGQPAVLRELVRVSGQPARAVDDCVAAGLLVSTGSAWDFRHALARLAVASTLPPGRAAALHAAALAMLTAEGSADDRRLAFHAEGCGDQAAVAWHAPRAAARAARLGAHREAAELYRMALRAHPGDDGERAALWSALSYESYLTGRLEEALDAQQQVLELADSPQATGVALRWLSRLSWFLGRNEDAERYAERAVATLEPLGPSAELAMAYSNTSQLRMLQGDHELAVEWGTRALELARALDDRDTQTHALNNIGTAIAQRRDFHAGMARLQQSLDLALATDAHEHAARAFTNLAATAVDAHQLRAADAHLRSGLAYCAERDLDSWEHYMSAWQARSFAEQGRYDEAREVVTRLLERPHLPAVVRIPALTVVAQLAVRAGEDDGGALEEAAALAQGTHESQRLVPVAVATGEAAWAAGRIEDARGILEETWAVAALTPAPWELGELAWWLSLAGAEPDRSMRLASPFRLMVDGAWLEAAEAWAQLGCPLWEALSLARSPELGAARRSLEIVDGLPAPATREAIVRDRRTRGLPVPRGPRQANRGNEAGLTSRELDVLALLVDGLSDADIASALVLSPRTVGHHVSSVLAKLGEPTRSRAVASALRRGILPPTE